jgi:hypothetical protein
VEIYQYNSLKKLVDNCSFEISIGKESLVKEKNVDLDKLISLLIEGLNLMKTH